MFSSIVGSVNSSITIGSSDTGGNTCNSRIINNNSYSAACGANSVRSADIVNNVLIVCVVVVVEPLTNMIVVITIVMRVIVLVLIVLVFVMLMIIVLVV